VRAQYNNWMAEECKKLTPTGRIQKPAYNVIAQWIKKAWDDIDPALIQRSFKCCGISNARDGSEDKLIFDFDSFEKKKSTSRVFIDGENNGEEFNESVKNHNSCGEGSNQGSNQNHNNCGEGSQFVSEGSVDKFNDMILDLGDENYDEYYNNEVENYVNTWF
ncbi:18204_t:CDS:1, partial [Acaulospora morrowiae]